MRVFAWTLMGFGRKLSIRMTDTGQNAKDDERFRDWLEAAPDPMVLVNEQGRIGFLNHRAEQLFGYTADELIDRPIDVLISDFWRVKMKKEDAGKSENDLPGPIGSVAQLFGLRKDGTRFPVEISVNPFQTPEGTLAIGAIRDISERVRIEQVFRTLVESAPDAMVIVNRDGKIVLVNAQTERVFGYRREDLIGQSVELLVPERYGHAHIAHRVGYFTKAHPRPMGMGLELFGRRKDGSEVPVEISLSPLQTDEGVLIASAIRDITERKAAEAERARLEQERAAHVQASRMKDEFLATLSHELRTPLNALLGWISLIGTGALAPDAVMRAHATIGRNARALAQLVDDLLDVSRIASGKLRLRSTALDLTEVADAAVEVVLPAAAAKEIHLQSNYQTRPILVIGDSDRLQQVVWNLLSNAVKFTPPNGRVELHIRASDRRIEILVRDTGQGISPSFLPHVFDRFRQADSSSTRPYGGLGLGLAIARSIVELHGGTIEAASSGEGFGATFRVDLPVAAMSERRKQPRFPASLDSLRNAQILIVDDQEDERALLRTIFEHQQCRVSTAASVAEAFKMLTTWKPDVIVSDLAMPYEDGYAFIRRIRQTPELQDIPMLAITAHARPEDRDAALAAGFRGYVPKPIDRDALLQRIAKLLTPPSAHVGS